MESAGDTETKSVPTEDGVSGSAQVLDVSGLVITETAGPVVDEVAVVTEVAVPAPAPVPVPAPSPALPPRSITSSSTASASAPVAVTVYHEEQEWTLTDSTKIYAQAWTVKRPAAVVAIVHGVGEHSGRYTYLTNYLNYNGFTVVSKDTRGHGKSSGKRGHAENFEVLMDEIDRLLEYASGFAKVEPTAGAGLKSPSRGGSKTQSRAQSKAPAAIAKASQGLETQDANATPNPNPSAELKTDAASIGERTANNTNNEAASDKPKAKEGEATPADKPSEEMGSRDGSKGAEGTAAATTDVSSGDGSKPPAMPRDASKGSQASGSAPHALAAVTHVPIFLFGHSLGGCQVIYYALTRLSNPEKPPKIKVNSVIASAPWLILPKEPGKFEKFMGKLMHKLHSEYTRSTGLDALDISKDPMEVHRYREDPLNHDQISAGLFFSGEAAAKYNLEHAADLKVPMLVYHGNADKITSYQGSKQFVELAKKAKGKPDVNFCEFAGMFHEMHNEPERSSVFEIIKIW
eukprot:CAMPEP_0184694394 /NCGR_PEP_ID=MMETSP0313-20130426/2377_1 /TAXON_ID=2792 /ORGANISM="Porphyridium aerugineum, Strain SAG 1380-2" /LENGTH=517 /DNA_ID=CAMNT_0027152685 /DNA_START=160 /DNA_END=1710 /DNA_ORIENTATION=-